MPDLNITSGVTRHIFDLFRLFNDSRQFRLFLLTDGGDAAEKFKESFPGKLLLSSFLKRKYGPLSNLKFFDELKTVCESKEINIIHNHHRYPELISSFLPLRYNIKTVHTVHSLLTNMKMLSFRSDHLIAVSNSVRQNLTTRFKVKPEKVTTLYNFVFPPADKNELSTRASETNKKTFNVLYAGRFCYDKGTDILIKAAEIIAEKRNDIAFELVGEDYDKQYTSLYSKSYTNVKIHKPTGNMHDFYNRANSVAIPSRRDSFPYLMLEAGLYGKPVIAGKVDGLNEFLEHDKSGLLYDPEDAEGLAKLICYAADNKDKLQYLAEKHYRKVIADCNPDKYFDTLTNLYNDL